MEKRINKKHYLDGVKVGDTLYLWDRPLTVTRINGSSNYPIETNDDNTWSMDGWFYCGSPIYNARVFWQPVMQPVPPKPPPKWVMKVVAPREIRQSAMYGCKVLGEMLIPSGARDVRIVYEVEED